MIKYYDNPKVYGVKHKDDYIRASSRSGGIFTALTDHVLKNNGIIYGCILNIDNKVCHIRANNSEQRNKMRGSKYVQSNMGNIFNEVKHDLANGDFVLFSGTSCQIDGLRQFLNILQVDIKKLLCIDIVCHGVPSPKVWVDYIDWQEKKNKGKCERFDFRNKIKYGWADHVESIWINGEEIDSKIFTNLFYDHNILRPACFKCPYKSTIHPGDITIADYWGIDKAAPGFDDNKGVSLVLVNNEIGLELFNEVKHDVHYIKCRIENSLQAPLKEPFPKPKGRDEFWEKYLRYDFETIVRVQKFNQLKNKIKRKIKRMLFK